MANTAALQLAPGRQPRVGVSEDKLVAPGRAWPEQAQAPPGRRCVSRPRPMQKKLWSPALG